MRRVATTAMALLCCSGPLAAQRWTGLASGPFEVWTDAGDRAARERLAQLEQFRFALEQLLGKTDLHPLWPVRIIVLRSAKGAPEGLGLARDAFVGAAAAQAPLPRPLLKDLALRILQSGPRAMPDSLEQALAEVFSTLTTDGERITLGAPVPAEERSEEWALMHMLVVTPGYYSGLRVLIRNLEAGVEEEPAWRNAFGQTLPQLRQQARAYLSQGKFETVMPRSRTLRPERDFKPLSASPGVGAILLADLAMSDPNRTEAARQAWRAAIAASPGAPEALEGMGLLELREGRKSDAYGLLKQAVEAGSSSARAWLEYGLLESDAVKAVAAFERAAKLNPRWGLPYWELARREKEPLRRAFLLLEAAKRDPRNVHYWQEAAETQQSAGQHIEAAKTWAQAVQAAADPEEKERLRQMRLQAEARREQQEAEAKRRAEEEEAKALERLKQESIARIQAALDKAQRENPPMPSSGPVVPWWDGPQADAKVSGRLVQVDCLGKQARLVIQTGEGKTVRLLVADPTQISILGAGQKEFGCGPQKPPRNIRVEYFTKPDAKLGTAGEVAVLEFP